MCSFAGTKTLAFACHCKESVEIKAFRSLGNDVLRHPQFRGIEVCKVRGTAPRSRHSGERPGVAIGFRV